ncbi:hypothetical protein [Roseicella aquatilis]|uniref:KTSC domain-containing protein n=1 Tax=Roseicella aquatilis TaxID=2527868 RepID=A0A4R4DXZ3_9PROT|nr:hypothetical protein [Roseicella aquatilis]TCZ66679.1 hypothetical protein EXY23_00770 [Roseicella aquatilis]
MLRRAALAAIACGPQMAAAAEMCSTSTLVSPTYASARWCGEPPEAGTLRLTRRDGSLAEFRDVPLATFREVVRVPKVGQYVATEIVPRFPGQGARPDAPPAPARAASGASAGRIGHPAATPSPRPATAGPAGQDRHRHEPVRMASQAGPAATKRNPAPAPGGACAGTPGGLPVSAARCSRTRGS